MPASTSSFASDTGGSRGPMAQTSSSDESASELVRSQASAEEAVFGVVYSISREKQRNLKFIVLSVIFDFLQLFVFIAKPYFGWGVGVSDLWRVVSVPIADNPYVSIKGYTMYTATIIVVAALLFAAFVSCIVMSYFFKTNNSLIKWPVLIVRFVFNLIIGLFYVSALYLFISTFICQDIAGTQALRAFPDVACWQMPNVLLAAISALMILLLTASAFVLAFSSLEVNPNADNALGAASSRVEVRLFFCRTIMTVVSVVFFRPHLYIYQAIIFLAATSYMAYSTAKFVPYYVPAMNKLRASLFAVLAYFAFLQLILVASGATSSPAVLEISIAALAGSPFVFGAMALFITRKLHGFDVRPKIRKDPEGGFQVPFNFTADYQVEAAARFVRNDHKNEEVVAIGLAILNEGMKAFPDSALLSLAFGNFNIAYKATSPSGSSSIGQFYIDKAKRLNPSLGERFAIFVRERERKNRSQLQAAGESSMDLVSYVEFQKNHAAALKFYKGTLRTIRSFWRIVLSETVSLKRLAHSFDLIADYETRADQRYRLLLDRYPRSAKLMRSYAHFLEQIKNDPWHAEKYYAEAERIVTAAESARADGGEMGGSVDLLSQVNDKTDAVVVADDHGIIQLVNKKAATMFGYRKEEMIGRNLSMLMPEPYSHQHDTYLKNYITTGKAKVLGKSRVFEAMHRDGHTFRVLLAVNSVMSQKGQSFIGIMRSVEAEEMAQVVITVKGIIVSFNKKFLDMFQLAQEEALKKNIKIIMPQRIAEHHDGFLKHYVEVGRTVSFAGRRLVGRRKDGSEFPLTIELEETGEKDTKLLVGKLRELSDGLGILTIDEKGIIISANQHVCDLWGYNQTELLNENVSVLMPQPFSTFHNGYLRRYVQTGESKIVGRGRTVHALHKDGSLFPVKLELSETYDKNGARLFYGRATTWVPTAERPSPEQSAMGYLTINPAGVVSDTDDVLDDMLGLSDSETALQGESIMHFLIGARSVLEIRSAQSGKLLVWKSEEKGDIPVVVVPEGSQADGSVRLQVWPVKSVDAWIGLNHKGLILSCNSLCEILFGVKFAAVKGKPLVTFFSSACGDLVDKYLQQFLKKGKKKSIHRRSYAMGQMMDGSVIPLGIEIAAAGRTAQKERDPRIVLYCRLFYESEATVLAYMTQFGSSDRPGSARSSTSGMSGMSAASGASGGSAAEEPMLSARSGISQTSGVSSVSAREGARLDGKEADDDAISVEADDANAKKREESDAAESEAAMMERADELMSKSGSEAGGLTSTEYQKAKRYRRLVKVFDSSHVRRAINSLINRERFSMILLCLIFVIAFAVWRFFLSDHGRAIDHIVAAADGCAYALTAATNARWMAYLAANRNDSKSAALALLVNGSDAESNARAYSAMASQLRENAVTFEALMKRLYTELSSTSTAHKAMDAPVWVAKEALPTDSTGGGDGNATRTYALWQLSRRFVDSALVVAATNATGTLNSTQEWNFVISNTAEVLSEGTLALVEALAQEVEEGLQGLKGLAAGMIALDVIGVLVVLLFVIRPPLLRLLHERSHMFEIFLRLPRKEVVALARGEIQLDEDESDDDDDVDDDDAGLGMEGWNADEGADHESNDVGGAGDDDDDDDDYDNSAANKKRKGKKKKKSKKARAAQKKREAAEMKRRKEEERRNSAYGGESIHALPMKTVMMYTGVFVALAVISAVAFAASLVLVSSSVVSSEFDLPDAGRRMCISRAALFLASEVALGGYPAVDRASHQRALQLRALQLETIHQRLLYGAQLRADGKGSIFRNRAQTALLFFPSCLATQTKDCPVAGAADFEVTSNGLDVAFDYFVRSGYLIANETNAAALSPGNPEFAFMFFYGHKYIHDGLNTSALAYAAESGTVVSMDSTVQSALFVAMLGVLLVHYIVIHSPFLETLKRENHRTATLLCLLPTAVDVEKLAISSMLMQREDEGQAVNADADSDITM